MIVGFLVMIMGKSDAEQAMMYLQTWSDSVIWLFLGGFFLAEAMKKTSLDLLLLRHLLPKFGQKPADILLGLMLITALISMLMSNTATTAMMIATVSPIFTTMHCYWGSPQPRQSVGWELLSVLHRMRSLLAHWKVSVIPFHFWSGCY